MPTDTARLHTVFDLAMRIGEGMLTNGAAASEVTATVLRLTSSSGLRDVSVQVTFDEVSLSYLPDDSSSPFTRIRAAGARVQDFARLTEYEVISEGYIAGELSLEQARARASRIPQRKPLYPLLLAVSGYGLLGGGAAFSFGGGGLVMLTATIAGAVMTLMGEFLGRYRVPAFYSQVLGGFIAVSAAVVLNFFDPTVDSSLVIVGCIVMLLAGVASIGAMQDAVTGWYVTAAARLLEVLMLTVGIIVGVRGGLLVADAVGADISVSAMLSVSLGSVLVLAVAGGAMGLGFGIGTQVPVRLLFWAGAVGAASSAVAHVFTGLLQDQLWAVGVAAFVAGAAAVVLARRLNAPAVIFALAGVVPLVPGRRIYQGLVGLGEDMLSGGFELFHALEIAVAIAAGAVLGQLIMARIPWPRTRSAAIFTPVISSPFRTTRRRRRALSSQWRRRRTAEPVIEPSTMTTEMAALPDSFADTTMFEPPEDAVRSRSAEDTAQHSTRRT